MAELSEDFLGALYQVRASDLQDQIAAAQEAGKGFRADLLQKQLTGLPQSFSRRLMRDVNKPAGAAYERGLGSLQRKIDRDATLGEGVGERGAQLALGRSADVVGENLRSLYGERGAPLRFDKHLNVSLTPDQISKLQEMGYDPYEFMSEGQAGSGGFGLGSGFRATTGDAYDRAAARASRAGRDFNLQEGVQFTASAGLNPLSAEFFSGLGMFVDPRSGEQLARRPESVTEYGLSTKDPREIFADQARKNLYIKAAKDAMMGRDQEKFVSRMQSKLPSQYEAAMQGFQDVLAPQGQTLGSADPYTQNLQDLQGSLGSIAGNAYDIVQPAMESGQLAPLYQQFREQAVQDTGVKDPIALRKYYENNVAPNYKYSRAGFSNGNFGLIESSQDQVLAKNMQHFTQGPAMQTIMADPDRQAAYGQLQSAYQAPAQAATPSAGKGSGKGATNQQAQTAQSMFSGFT